MVKADLEGPAYKLVRPFHKNSISLQFQLEEYHLLLTYQINLMNPEGDKERRNALSISKLKAAYYPDFGLEELVPSLWIESERDYDISASYGISHLWFKHKEFYITRHNALSDQNALTTKNTRSRKPSDFKNLHPNDFEDMYLLHLQGNLNHLSGADKLGMESYQTKLNLTQPSWDASDILFKEDYTIVHKPRVVIYRDRNNQNKIMREFEVHKFSDGTLTRILEQLDHMVKYFVLFKFNPGMKHRIWSEDEEQRVHRGDREKA
ncbi:hypothetical protein Tco_1150223 [Tanacetum coccineum]